MALSYLEIALLNVIPPGDSYPTRSTADSLASVQKGIWKTQPFLYIVCVGSGTVEMRGRSSELEG